MSDIKPIIVFLCGTPIGIALLCLAIKFLGPGVAGVVLEETDDTSRGGGKGCMIALGLVCLLLIAAYTLTGPLSEIIESWK